ncbi:putative restriction endonuclease type II like protein [Erwinia phage pEa_SNUABM_50]|uniref:Exonuclease n=4 Tax=Eneladusvirus BF TaxID=2560751 RepID=A0A1S6UAR2_9CAUD|nr:exonuclease [Serratia phage BF]QOI71235.1 putative restriction endonuclease type II like protein [Erwinia phage pEa_SNUABM_12]QOI71779.1 putative restriction endonuclease type II like protein [Erwinia phage pEa_SNUABM_47]QOI72318.1 putative restriction endonuclease type II like protein [Erwinia phage pEa_SNUABM_50]QXO11444.1 hypothetical protein pEaSNUABM19_00298 [Erwinia phage pEa_SNUABM_19]QXO11992.1 hypothetical protein pEaSNUABM44_00296 [Erwinia phage pEa_SNUABM_44]QXO12545.1 hypotheti
MYIPPIVNKYTYVGYNRIEGGSEGRLYSTPSGNLPSVTTILSATSDNEGLKKWREFVGEDKANAITLEATTVGTFMHENLERRLVGDQDHLGGMPIRVLARNMADCIQQNAWPKINEVWGQEVPLFYEGLWAGTTDLVGIHDGLPAIMDYKNSRKPKTWEYIENYRLQLAAYALAHNAMFGTDINRGVIFICVRKDPANLQYQEFVVEGADFEEAKRMWIERVEQFYAQRGEM